MKLPKSIIKKYGITKKAWRVFKSQKKRGGTMARRKRRFKLRTYGRRKRSKFGDLGIIIGGMTYGALREKLNEIVTPITSKIPLGYTADNIVLGGISYLLMKGKIPLINKIPLTRQIGRAGLTIESALLGQDLMKGTIKTAEPSSNRWTFFR